MQVHNYSPECGGYYNHCSATYVHVPLSSTVINTGVINRVICYHLSQVIVIEKTSQVSKLRVQQNSRVSCKVMP